MGTVARAVRALHQWGVGRLILTCSAGGITEGLHPGDLVLLSDHINFQGANPLFGALFGGTRFPDMSDPYDSHMRAVLREVAQGLGCDLPEGVYAAMNGPAYETAAEIRMLRTIGADLVGMSTVPEVLAARALGVRTAAVALVSNRATGLSAEALSHEEVTAAGHQAAGRLADLLEGALGQF